MVLRAARHGEQWIRAQSPGFAEVLAAAVSDEERIQLFASAYWAHNKSRPPRFPPPSRLFPGLDPALDDRLIRDHRDTDVTLCRALAAVPTHDQREFLELYLLDPIDARHWATLPRWKRPIRKGDKDDIQIFKFFTMQRLNMELHARGTAWPMASQGAQLPQMFGALAYLSLEGLKRLVIVMNSYGDTLQHGRDLGNVSKKPWEEKP